MSVIRSIPYPVPGMTLKTVLRDYSTGVEELWNNATSSFEPYDVNHITNYQIITPEGSPGRYCYTIPASLPPSTAGCDYIESTYRIVGANLAAADFRRLVADDKFGWTGTQVQTVGVIITNNDKTGYALSSSERNALAAVIAGGLQGTSNITINFHDSNGNPVPNALFTVIGKGSFKANSSGVANFGLDPGTYSIITGPSGLILFPTSTLVVVGDTQITITGAASNLQAAPPGKTTGYLTTRNAQGDAVPNVTLKFQLINPHQNVDQFDLLPFTATSDTNGLLQTFLIQSARYTVKSDRGNPKNFTTTNNPTFSIPQVLG